MKSIKAIFLFLIFLFFVQVLLTGINILQNGGRTWDGRSPDAILGVPAGEATVEDVENLSKADLMQLFFATAAPEFTSMWGEYRARMVPTGVQAFVNEAYAHYVMGPGHWEAKAFFPFHARKGWGYNLFRLEGNDLPKTLRTMKMDTSVGPSRFDGKDSFHLVYAAYNDGLNHTMRDEIRKINERLFIGVGCLAWNLDTMNPAFFLLHGDPEPWIGPDDE